MVKTAICYFSGTGNSFDITLELCKYIDVEFIFYLPNLDIKKLAVYDEVIIVSPVYQFNIPKNVQDFIRKLSPDSTYYVVLNHGGIIGKAKSNVKKLFKHCNLNLLSVYKIIMPSSFTIAFKEPHILINRILKKSKSKIQNIAYLIKKIEKNRINQKRIGKMKRFVGYSSFSNDLSVNLSCKGCEKCLAFCPTGNIRRYQGKIEFGDRCVACMACYNRCDAVEYKGKKGKMYTNPNVDFNLMK